ncbi:MAG: RNA polymerase sigma factor, partial [Bacteroidota bacterium]
MAEFVINNQHDQHLLRRCVDGSRESQSQLYHLFAPKMFGICIRYANDYHHAEDILQEGFIKVFNNLHRYRYQGSFEGWLKRIFINTAIEHYRKAKSRYRFQELEAARHHSIEPEVLHYLSQEELLKLIHRLPIGYRTVFN